MTGDEFDHQKQFSFHHKIAIVFLAIHARSRWLPDIHIRPNATLVLQEIYSIELLLLVSCVCFLFLPYHAVMYLS